MSDRDATAQGHYLRQSREQVAGTAAAFRFVRAFLASNASLMRDPFRPGWVAVFLERDEVRPTLERYIDIAINRRASIPDMEMCDLVRNGNGDRLNGKMARIRCAESWRELRCDREIQWSDQLLRTVRRGHIAWARSCGPEALAEAKAEWREENGPGGRLWARSALSRTGPQHRAFGAGL